MDEDRWEAVLEMVYVNAKRTKLFSELSRVESVDVFEVNQSNESCRKAINKSHFC